MPRLRQGATALSALIDVDVSTDPPADDDVFAWDADAQKWTPASLAAAGAQSAYTPPPYFVRPMFVGIDTTGLDNAHGTLPWDTAGNWGDVTLPKGTMSGGWCDRRGTLNAVGISVTSTLLGPTEGVKFLCYALDANGKFTGNPVWEVPISIGTTTGPIGTTVGLILPANGCCLFILNPFSNTNSVTIKHFQPTGPYNFATVGLNVRPSLLSNADLTTAPDLTSYTVNSAVGPGRFAASQRMPSFFLR